MSGHVGNPAMPVIQDLRDFDLNSGNLLERFIFNNRAPVLLACLIATVVLGFFALKLDVNASFERMIPSSSPYIRNYLENKAELPGLGNTIRIVVENKTGDIYNAEYLETLRKLKAAQYAAAHPGEVCPAKWNEGAKTIAPSIDPVGKI